MPGIDSHPKLSYNYSANDAFDKYAHSGYILTKRKVMNP